MSVPEITLDELIDQVLLGVGNGWSTEEIAADVGIKYQSILRRFFRNGYFGTARTAIINLRHAEADARQVVHRQQQDFFFRERCAHGWWSSDGGCHHGEVDLKELARKRRKKAA